MIPEKAENKLSAINVAKEHHGHSPLPLLNHHGRRKTQSLRALINIRFKST